MPSDFYIAIRTAVIAMLGGKCVHCGIDDWRVLELNHINNDGNWRKRSKGGGGFNLTDLRAILRDESLRAGLELLCANCHALRTKGYI